MSDEKVFAIVLFLLTGNQNKDRDDLTNIINKSGATRGHVLFISYRDNPKTDISEADRINLLNRVNPQNIYQDPLPYAHTPLNIHNKENMSDIIEKEVVELVDEYESDNYICRVFGSELLRDGCVEKSIFKRIEARQRIRRNYPRYLKDDLECAIILAMGEICSTDPKTLPSKPLPLDNKSKNPDDNNEQINNNDIVMPRYLSAFLEYNAEEKAMYAHRSIIMYYPHVLSILKQFPDDTSQTADETKRENFWEACSLVYGAWDLKKNEQDYHFIAVENNTRPHIHLCINILRDFRGGRARNGRDSSAFSENPLIRSNGENTSKIKYTLTDLGLALVSDIRDADLYHQLPAYTRRNRGRSESLPPKVISQSDEQILEANLQIVRQLYDDGKYDDALNVCNRIYEEVRYSPPRNIAMLHIEKCKCLIELGNIWDARTSLDQAYILGGYDDAIQAIIADIKSKYKLGEIPGLLDFIPRN